MERPRKNKSSARSVSSSFWLLPRPPTNHLSLQMDFSLQKHRTKKTRLRMISPFFGKERSRLCQSVNKFTASEKGRLSRHRLIQLPLSFAQACPSGWVIPSLPLSPPPTLPVLLRCCGSRILLQIDRTHMQTHSGKYFPSTSYDWNWLYNVFLLFAPAAGTQKQLGHGSDARCRRHMQKRRLLASSSTNAERQFQSK